MVMLYRASSLPMMAVLRSSCLSLSCNVLTFHVHIFNVSFRPQCWMTSSPRFAGKSGLGQLFLGNVFYSLPRLERAVLPLNRAALTPWQDTNGLVTPLSMTKRPSHRGRQRAGSWLAATIDILRLPPLPHPHRRWACLTEYLRMEV